MVLKFLCSSASRPGLSFTPSNAFSQKGGLFCILFPVFVLPSCCWERGRRERVKTGAWVGGGRWEFVISTWAIGLGQGSAEREGAWDPNNGLLPGWGRAGSAFFRASASFLPTLLGAAPPNGQRLAEALLTAGPLLCCAPPPAPPVPTSSALRRFSGCPWEAMPPRRLTETLVQVMPCEQKLSGKEVFCF